MDKGYLFTNRAEIRAIDKENFTITHIVNTKTLDRHGTVVLPSGVIVDKYLKNPVVLAIHNGKQLPIGKCIDLKVTDEKIEATTLFNKNDSVSMLFFRAYEDGFMNAWSIGFIPLKHKKFDEENYQDLNTKYDLNVTLDQIKDAGFWGIYLIYEWELLEYSAVPIPANPEALNELATRGFTVIEEEEKDIRESLAEKSQVRQSEQIENKDNIQENKIEEELEERKIIPYKKYDLAPEDTKWDGNAEVKKAEVKDLKIICTWYDVEKEDTKGAYKLPHHQADGYKTVWNGVKAAMGALLGARGGVNIPESDRNGIYNHLAKHYKEFEKEVPEFKTFEQLEEENNLMVEKNINSLSSVTVEISERIEEINEKIISVEQTINNTLDSIDKRILKLENSISETIKVVDEKSSTKEVTNIFKKLIQEINEIRTAISVDNIDGIREAEQKLKNDKDKGNWINSVL